ncbi:MAG TPA: hypothetical protein VMI75_34515 [Polyangiaceae bacterium]|nr:hypothetical protein [Polyangiaceae bacterium]
MAAPAATTFAQAQADLQNQVVLVVQAGDTYYGESQSNYYLDYTDAVLAYQAAGQAGATSLGPEIDAAGAASITSPLTHQAWALNAQLAAITKSGPANASNGLPSAYFTKADADKAKALVTQMVSLYDQAISQGSSSTGHPISPPSVPATPAPVVEAPSFLPVLAFGTVVAAIATVVITRSTRRNAHV